jgi:DNA-binding transcriptional regulator YdaS (Cro superfamily)
MLMVVGMWCGLQRHKTVVPVSVHSLLGSIVCTAMVAQICYGVEKLTALRAPRVERAGGGLHR